MAATARDIVSQRKDYSEGWEDKMVYFWEESINDLEVLDTGALRDSLRSFDIEADSRYLSMELTHDFFAYGLWQDLGVGREVPHANSGDIGRDKKRKRRRWFSAKYYYSTMRFREFMSESLGNEFKAMVSNAFDAEQARFNSEYYKRKGWSR